MNIKAFFKKLLVTASVYFLLITAGYVAISMIVNITDDEVYLRASQLLFHFFFSLLAAGAWSIYRLTKFHSALRLLLHYGILLFSFYLCFLVPASMRAPQIAIGIVLFSLLYAIIMAITAFFLSRFRANAEKESTYTKQFTKKQ